MYAAHVDSRWSTCSEIVIQKEQWKGTEVYNKLKYNNMYTVHVLSIQHTCNVLLHINSTHAHTCDGL